MGHSMSDSYMLNLKTVINRDTLQEITEFINNVKVKLHTVDGIAKASADEIQNILHPSGLIRTSITSESTLRSDAITRFQTDLAAESARRSTDLAVESARRSADLAAESARRSADLAAESGARTTAINSLTTAIGNLATTDADLLAKINMLYMHLVGHNSMYAYLDSDNKIKQRLLGY